MNYENQFLNVIGSGVTSNINRSSLTTQDFSMPNIPQQSVVVRGSALSNVNRANLVMDSRPNVGNVATLDPLMRQRSVLEGQLAMVDAEMASLVNEIERQKQHRVDLDNLIKQYVKWIADYDNKGDLYKISHPSERKGYERKRDLYLQEFDATTQQINSLTDKYNNELIPKRKAIADELASLGVPKSKLGGRSFRDRLDRMESREASGATIVANKIVDEVKNTFSGGGGFGGGGGGFGGGSGDEMEDGATNQSFFGQNKMAILALGGVVGYLLLKR
jgi:hypothetical protein